MYGGQRHNNYELQQQRMREAACKDKDKYYTFSNDFLSLSMDNDVTQLLPETSHNKTMLSSVMRQSQGGVKTSLIHPALQIDSTPYHQ